MPAREVIYALQAGVIGNYAAEIIFFLFKVAESMLEPSVRLFIYKAVCLQEVNSFHRCKYLEQYPEYEHIVQSTSAQYLMFYKILLNIPAILLVLLCGAWSDRSGRKLPIMLTCFGGMVSVMMYMLSNHMGPSKGPYLPLILVGAGIRGFCGRSAVMTMACHSYVSDITSEEMRTRKLAHLAAMSHFGYLTGCTIAGSLLDIKGFVMVFCCVQCLQAICFMLASICMRTTVVERSAAIETVIENDENPVSNCKENKRCTAYLQLRSCIRVVTKPRRGHTRCYLFLLLAVCCVQQTCKSGELDMVLLYVQKAPLSWKNSLYSYLLGVDFACLGFVAFFILPCLIRFLAMGDKSLIVTGLTFKLARTVMLAFSNTTWMIFTAISIGAPHALTISGLKSTISKLVETDEIGKTFSILSCIETISNLMGTVIFTNTYAAMLPIWPGFGFALEAGMYVIIYVLMIIFTCAKLDRATKPLLERTVESPPIRKYGATDQIPKIEDLPTVHICDYNSQDEYRNE